MAEVILTVKPTFRSAESTTLEVSRRPPRSMTRVARRTFMLSAGVLATASTSLNRPISSVKAFHEPTLTPLMPTTMSPRRMPIRDAAEPGSTLSTSAGMSGRTNDGCFCSMSSMLRSPGRLRLMALPWRTMSTRRASDRSR